MAQTVPTPRAKSAQSQHLHALRPDSRSRQEPVSLLDRTSQSPRRISPEGPGCCPSFVYTTRMKRANLVLDAELLDQVTRALGVKTYSAAVSLALAEVFRLRKMQSLPQFFG